MTKMLIVTPMIYELLKDYEEQNAVNQWIHRNTIDTIAKQYSYLEKENQQLKSVLNEVKEYVKNELKNFERLINTSPTPSFYQLPYGVCVSILNKIENGGSNE